MPNPQIRPRSKPGRPRGRPPASRSTNSSNHRSTDPHEGIIGFDLSPSMTRSQDIPPTTMTSPPIPHHDETFPRSSKPPIIIERQSSQPSP
ncbi:hypothetical protein JTE90_016745, partial [Oedothorax gibbosus]